MIRFLREIRDLIASPLRRSQSELQESLASTWVAIKLRVECGDLDPNTSIYVPPLQPGRGSSYMTVQSLLKTIQHDWGHWDHKTMAWWCEVLDRTNGRLSRRRMPPGRERWQGDNPRLAP